MGPTVQAKMKATISCGSGNETGADLQPEGRNRKDAASCRRKAMNTVQEQLLEIHVRCFEAISVKGRNRSIVMIPFDGNAEGLLFSGRVNGQGVDTQTIEERSVTLSARYMLEGKDAEGNSCRIFIENQGNMETGLHPRIVTDSPLLRGWEGAELSSTVEGAPGGVTVRIFRTA